MFIGWRWPVGWLDFARHERKYEATQSSPMRPEILNPLFAALTDLKGVGPQLAKPLARLGLERVVDILFHLPTGLVQRHRVDRLDDAQPGQQIIIMLTAQDYRSGRSPRAPFGVDAFDAAGDHVRLVYFGRTSGLARKLFPLGEARQVSGRLDTYGEMRQIVHPDHVSEAGSDAAIATSEAVYPLTEGLTNARLTQLVEIALERRPELAEWIDASLLPSRCWPAWREALARAHASPHDAAAHDRLAYDEIFASQVALMLIREGLRKRKGRAVVGDGRLIDALRLPFGLTVGPLFPAIPLPSKIALRVLAPVAPMLASPAGDAEEALLPARDHELARDVDHDAARRAVVLEDVARALLHDEHAGGVAGRRREVDGEVDLDGEQLQAPGRGSRCGLCPGGDRGGRGPAGSDGGEDSCDQREQVVHRPQATTAGDGARPVGRPGASPRRRSRREHATSAARPRSRGPRATRAPRASGGRRASRRSPRRPSRSR